MDRYVKRIQSRLAYHGVSLSKDVCREAYKKYIPEEKWENPKPTEVALVVEKLMEWDDVMSQVDTPEQSALEIQEPDKVEENAIALSEENAITSIDQEQKSAVTLQPLEKQALALNQASTLSIVLEQSELKSVAGAIADEYQTFEDAVLEVTALIKSILTQRNLKASNTLREALQDIVGTAQNDFT